MLDGLPNVKLVENGWQSWPKFRQSVASRPGEGQEQDEHGEQARYKQESRPAKHAVEEGLGRLPAGGAISH